MLVVFPNLPDLHNCFGELGAKQHWWHAQINWPIRGHNPFLVNPPCDLQILPSEYQKQSTNCKTIASLKQIYEQPASVIIRVETRITGTPLSPLDQWDSCKSAGASYSELARVGRESGGGRCWTDSILLTLQSHTAEGTGRCTGCLCWSVCGELYFSSSDPYESDIERVLWSLWNRRIKHFTAGTLFSWPHKPSAGSRIQGKALKFYHPSFNDSLTAFAVSSAESEIGKKINKGEFYFSSHLRKLPLPFFSLTILMILIFTDNKGDQLKPGRDVLNNDEERQDQMRPGQSRRNEMRLITIVSACLFNRHYLNWLIIKSSLSILFPKRYALSLSCSFSALAFFHTH